MKRTFFAILMTIWVLAMYMNYGCIYYLDEAPLTENFVISLVYLLIWFVAIWDVSANDKNLVNMSIVFWSINILLISMCSYHRASSLNFTFVNLLESLFLAPFACLFKLVGEDLTSMEFLSIFLSNIYILIASRNLFKKPK